MIFPNKHIPASRDSSKNLTRSKVFFRRCLGLLPAVIIFPIMLWTLSGNLGTLFRQTIDFNPWLLVASAVLLLGHFVISGLGWWLILYFFGGDLSPYQAVRISALSMLGKYIPGKIWTVAGKIYMANAKGVCSQLAFVASVYEFVLVNISGIFIFFILEIIFLTEKLYLDFIFFIFLLLATILLAWPNSITLFLNHTLRIVKQPLVTTSLKRWQFCSVFLYYVITWLICGYSFSLFVWGFFPELTYFQLTSALVLAYIIGFIAIFSPGGVGVREGTITSLLIMSGVTSDVAVFIALCSRIWSTAGELLFILPMYFFQREKFQA